MSAEFHNLEESLKEHLMESQSDKYTTMQSNFYKYNNLKITMDPKKHPDPHFLIRIGISESIYDLETGEKVAGGLGSDEREVRRWIEKSWGRFDLQSTWKNITKPQTVTMNDSE